MGDLGASCFNTLNDKTRDIEKPEWDQYRFGMLCAKPAVFADMKRTILQLCQAYKKCVYDPKENKITFYENNKKATVVKFFNELENFTMEVNKMKGEL